MAMNKKEQAELAAAKREARLRELIVLQPRIPPDIPAPVEGKQTCGWKFNPYGNTLNVVRCLSTSAMHCQLDNKGRRVGSERRISAALYSTRELAFEAVKREIVWLAAEEIINKVEQYEQTH